MTKSKIILDFVRLKAAEKPPFGSNVVTRMTENPVFPTPDIPLTQIRTASELLQNRCAAALNGGKDATALLHQAIGDWDELMRKEAMYVERIADGDETIILGAGFNVAAPKGPGQRSEFSVEQGSKSGEIVVRHAAIAGARSYIWQIYVGDAPPANDSEWQTGGVTTKSTATLDGLTVLSHVWVRVAGVTTAGTTAYCQPISIIVL